MANELYIGLMSGTSLDGVDAVVVDLSSDFPCLIASHIEPFPDDLRTDLLALTQPGESEIDRMGEADIRFAALQSQAVRTLLSNSGISTDRIRAIGSHGQTIRHRPDFKYPFTLQIGDPSQLAERCGITVVADFRRRDMAAGGQGAPLVPAFHEYFLRSAKVDRMVLNIGGMANVTLLERDPKIPALGYDTGPGNVLMDSWISRHHQQNYDRNGDWAAAGKIDRDLLGRLMQTPYLSMPAPKSTGRELFHIGWLDRILTDLSGDRAPADVQATLLEFTALSICEALQRHSLHSPELYLCGGGASNTRLLDRIKGLLADYSVSTTDELGLPSEWLEACAFGWLAKACMEGTPGNLPSVTGARGRRILGAIYQA